MRTPFPLPFPFPLSHLHSLLGGGSNGRSKGEGTETGEKKGCGETGVGATKGREWLRKAEGGLVEYGGRIRMNDISDSGRGT